MTSMKSIEATAVQKPKQHNTRKRSKTAKAQQQDENKQQENQNPTRGSQHIFFGPRSLSDLVIHHQQYSYHVHTFVLHSASSLFKKVILGESLTLSSSSSQCSICSTTTSCPQKCIDLSPQTLGGTNHPHHSFMLLFLHLYHADKYSVPPFLRKDVVGITVNAEGALCFSDAFCVGCDDDSRPVLEFPQLKLEYAPSAYGVSASELPLSSLLSSPSKTSSMGTEPVICDDVLKLARFLECAPFLSQCERVLTSYVSHLFSRQFDTFWVFLLYSQDHHWNGLKKLCVTRLATDKQYKSNPQYQKVARLLSKQTLWELYDAAVKTA